MLFIDLLVLVLHMVREIWRETGRIKAGKNLKVTKTEVLKGHRSERPC